MRRVIVTVVAVAIWLGMARITLPYIDVALLDVWGNFEGMPRLTVLGVGPFVTGFLFTEFANLSSVRGRERLRGGPADRAVLFRHSVIVSVLSQVCKEAGRHLAGQAVSPGVRTPHGVRGASRRRSHELESSPVHDDDAQVRLARGHKRLYDYCDEVTRQYRA